MKQKVKDLLYILVIYTIALAAAILTLKYTPIDNILWKTALADGVAMIIVFLFSMRNNNSSIYDPYWSAAPIFIVIYWLFNSGQIDFYYKIIWGLITIWGIRLTWNWILRWDGLFDEDWRYVNIRKKTGKFYWPVSFIAIHLLPTILVFAGLVPIYYLFNSNYSTPTSWFTVIAVLFTLGGIYLEKTSDDALRDHIKSGRSKTELIQKGFWLFFKYPNYMGEVGFWWGLYFTAIAVDQLLYWTIFGPVSITLLFYFISIPMMKKRLSKKIYK
jgi:steroid 5-alpha reductase family enzyme